MITAIIQARMSSTRLPGKVMIRFSGNSLLGHIVERLSFSNEISKVVVATTVNSLDDEIVAWSKEHGIGCYRGSETDVLGRYFEAAKMFEAVIVARITSDDPFKDPGIIDHVAAMFRSRSLDFAYNNKPPSFAEGLDTEIFSFEALARAAAGAIDPFEREHVTQYFYRNAAKFKQENLLSPVDYSHLRWTIDTSEDMAMAQAVYRNLYKPGKIFLAQDILELLQRKPEITEINRKVKRSDMYIKD
jgi:spore coat polysaccharide biosynthesis protein SpsF